MRFMNKICISSALACTVMFSGCSNFLEKEPIGVVYKEEFLKTESQFVRAVTAIYDVTAWDAQEMYEWMLGDICSDDADKGGESDADYGELLDLEKFRWDESNSILEGVWADPYQGIYRANLVINQGATVELEDTDLQARLIGEAQFLRAYFYFNLVKTFGGVPLVLKHLEPSEYNMARNTETECWAQIEEDLLAAIEALPVKSEYADSDLGRATKGAAQALLVKAYMYQGKTALAEPLANDIITSGEYDLEANYADIFTLHGENGTESIFEIQHSEIATGEWGNDNEGQITSIFQGGRDNAYFAGWGFNVPSEDLVNAYEAGDVRKGATIIVDGDTLYQGTEGEFVATGANQNRKYLLEYQENVPEMSNASANWRVIRFADILLFHAEAANANNNSTDALISLNKVRARAGLTDITETNKAKLAAIILQERRVELALEGHRYFDLVRTGQAKDVLPGFVAGQHEHFLIPGSELSANPNLVQN